jgi:hypothetical protein
VADAPDTLTLKRNRDLEGFLPGIWIRRGILALLAAFLAVGLANVFGQRPVTQSATVAAAKLTVYAPDRLRGGDLFSARFHVTARRELKDARLVLDEGWAEGMAINTIEPSPLGEASDDGRLSLDLGHVPAGNSYVLYMQFQVNPTNLAWNRPAGVRLLDGDTLLATVHRSLIVFP